MPPCALGGGALAACTVARTRAGSLTLGYVQVGEYFKKCGVLKQAEDGSGPKVRTLAESMRGRLCSAAENGECALCCGRCG